MFDVIVILLLIFTFLYSKNRIDQLKSEVASLKSGIIASREPGENNSPAVSKESPEIKILQEPSGVISLPENNNIAGEEKIEDSDFEFKIGGKMFTAIGMVAVIFAVGFFLRYAFENDLINELARVLLGVAAGVSLVAAGEITRRRFSGYSQVLTGGGLGILYLSFYAAFNLYNLITQPFAFLIMILITAAGIVLSLRYNSMSLAVFSQIGGFITPLLIDNGGGSPHIIFLYVALLDLSVLATAFYKLWQPLSLLSFIGTALSFIYWYSVFYDPSQFTAAQGYLSLFFIIFLFIPFIQYAAKKSPENSWDLSLVAANPLFYFAVSYTIIDPLYPDLMGWFTIILGSLYCVLASAVGRQDDRSSLFQHFLLTVGFVLLAIAVPVQFDGKWIAIAWIAESLAFIASGFKLRFKTYRILGNFVFLMALLRILFFESRLSKGALPLFNERLFIYMFFLAAAAAAAYLYRIKKSEVDEGERPVFSLLALEGAFMGLVGPTLEINDFPKYFGSQWYPIFWTAGGLAAGMLSFRLKSVSLRCVTYLTFAVSFFRLIFFESYIRIAKNIQYIPIFNKRLLGFSASAVIIRYFLEILRQNKNKVSKEEFSFFEPLLFVAFHLLMLWLLSFEIINWCDWQAIQSPKISAVNYANLKNVLLSVSWALYGAALLVTGIVKKTAYERFTALSLFAIVIAKVFLVDTADLGDLYRFFSFITLGGILLLAGYLYYRYQDRIREFVKGG